ncbi:MobA/MobL family protein, partial [Marinobacter pelagius]
MASTTCSIKPVKRSAGRSATAAAAYRAGAEVIDHRTGEIHDYTRKGGVVSAEIIAPDHAPEWAHDREALWNAAELAENRQNSQVAREFLIGLPHELDEAQRQELAHEFAQSLVDRYGFAVEVCIHKPDKGGDQRNHHAHILATTRRMGPEGLTEKTRELDDRTKPKLKNGEKGEARGVAEVRWVRQQFEDLTNAHLERAGLDERIDMRSYEDQGLDIEPTQHMGPAATAMERRKPGSTRIGQENVARLFRNEDLVHEQILVEVEE